MNLVDTRNADSSSYCRKTNLNVQAQSQPYNSVNSDLVNMPSDVNLGSSSYCRNRANLNVQSQTYSSSNSGHSAELNLKQVSDKTFNADNEKTMQINRARDRYSNSTNDKHVSDSLGLGLLERTKAGPSPVFGRRLAVEGETKLPSVKKLSWIFVSRLHPNVVKDDIDAYLIGNGVTGHCCENVESRFSSYKSFKVGVNGEQKSKILDPDFWEEGILVKDFVPKRRRPFLRNK